MNASATPKNNAVIYARYSSHAQNEQSIEGQLRDCYAFAKRENINVIGEYIDRALTGRTDDRPDFQRMIQDAKKREFQYIIVYKLDRFTRNRYDSAIYKHKLKQYDVKVLSAMENISDSPEGIILEAVLEASAEYYSLELSQKIKRGQRESALKGNYISGTVPIGYKVENKRLIIDEQRAPIIKQAFERYAESVSKKEIVAELTAKGIRAKNGKPYGNTAFQTALRSKKYIGVMKWKNIEVENACPALVDKQTFDKVQARLDLNKKAGATKKARMEYLLFNKLFCRYCGAHMIGDCGTSKMGVKHYYYSCHNKKNKRICKKISEKKDYLEWYVVEQTLEYVLTPARMDIIAEAVVEEYEKEFNSDKIKELEKRLKKIEHEIDKLFQIMVDSDSKAAMKRAEEKIKLLELQQADIEIDISKLKIINGIRYTVKEIKAWLTLFCNGNPVDLDFRKKIIDVFINAVYLYDDKIVIYYNIRDGKQISYIEMLESTEQLKGDGDNPANESANSDKTDSGGVRVLNDMLHFLFSRRKC